MRRPAKRLATAHARLTHHRAPGALAQESRGRPLGYRYQRPAGRRKASEWGGAFCPFAVGYVTGTTPMIDGGLGQ
ncbi:hypothetical protein scyTo_0017783 [Scyliorhinus torazame]|uniref:Uncharacterized protein n=1 Tax=Scyliorhinus torazame TaxID=75743 RepID=A0A401Q076_SCYTO|nr:hypothetical protein [Scyliorhinus torazame]